MEADYFEKSWKSCCFGGFLFGREAIRKMLRSQEGTLLFTGASASLRGRTNFAAFNSAKSGLRSPAQAMAKEYSPKGIHIGHIVFYGAIEHEKIKKSIPDPAKQKGKKGKINTEGIVESYVYLFNQSPSAWIFEVDLRTSIEKW
jgi:hypothetical protein